MLKIFITQEPWVIQQNRLYLTKSSLEFHCTLHVGGGSVIGDVCGENWGREGLRDLTKKSLVIKTDSMGCKYVIQAHQACQEEDKNYAGASSKGKEKNAMYEPKF